MTNPERNAFERELQKDLFSEEAADGFATVTPGDVESDISVLNERLRRRIGQKQRILYYRIAASVAVLMLITSILIITERSNRTKAEKKARSEQVALAAPVAKSVPDSQNKVQIPEKLASPEVRKTEKAAPVAVVAESEKERSPSITINPEIKKKSGKNPVSDTLKINKIVTADQVSIPEALAGGEKADTDQRAKDKLAAQYNAYGKNKDVAATRAVRAAEPGKKEVEGEYVPAEPSIGYNEFYRYIEENQRRLDILKEGEKAVVVMSFIVRNTGSIDSIKIIRSPGPLFSGEAERLLREGPAWRPARKNGSPVDEVMRIRIVLK